MPTSTSAPVRIALFGHVSATPAALTKALGDQGISIEATSEDIAHVDCAIFAVNPSAGIDAETITAWESFNDYLTPRIMVALALPGAELDFDDAVSLANRVFDQMATPYLVLHDDGGAPCALINLKDLTIHDYSTAEFKIYPCDEDHKVVIQEFREEHLASLEEFGEDSFVFGLFIPAIPLSVKAEIGFNEIMDLIKLVNDQQSL